MIKNLIGGICVGIANIIPGISGGTIMVLLGLFDGITHSISTIFSLKSKLNEKIKAIVFLFQVVLGAVIGLIIFAKILEYLFSKIPNQTLCFFSGLILLSLPSIKKKEINGYKINKILFIIGILIILILTILNPTQTDYVVPLSELLEKTLNLDYMIDLIFIGFITGATMIFPGISGSMVILILGKYYLFQAYVSNVTSFELKIIIPLILIAIGTGIGIILSSVVTSYLLKNHKINTMSLIFGLIVASGIFIIPTTNYDLITLITSVIAFILGGSVIYVFERKKIS